MDELPFASDLEIQESKAYPLDPEASERPLVYGLFIIVTASLLAVTIAFTFTADRAALIAILVLIGVELVLTAVACSWECSRVMWRKCHPSTIIIYLIYGWIQTPGPARIVMLLIYTTPIFIYLALHI